MSNTDPTPDPEEVRPDWLPDNFVDGPALAKSYAEASRKITEQGQQLSELNESVESLTELAATLQQAPPQYQQQSQDPAEQIYAQYENAMNEGDYRSALAIQAQIGQLAAQAAVKSYQQDQQPQWQQNQQRDAEIIANQATYALKTAYPDFDEYTDRVADTIKGNSALLQSLQNANTPTAFASILDSAYKLAKYEDSQTSALAQVGQAEAAKLAAQTATGSGPARQMSPDAAQAEWAAIKNSGGQSPWTSR